MEFTASQIAQFIGGTIEGDGEARVSTFAKIEDGAPGTLSFLANPKYTHYIYETKASAVLVSNDFVAEAPVSATLIRVANPYETLSELMRIVARYTESSTPTGIEQPSFIAEGVEIPDKAYIGAFSYIGKGVKLGFATKIYPQVYIGDNVEIGDHTVIYPGVKIYHGCRIGKNCIIHAGVVIGADGFGFAPDGDGRYHKIPQMGIVEIGDDVEIGANTCIDRATMGTTVVGRGTKLDNLIQLAHNTEVGYDTAIAAQTGLAGSTKIGNNCRIGGQVGFNGHITIGNNVEIGAQSGVPSSIPDNARMMGYPAVPANDFMRQAAYVRRLPELFTAVSSLEKIIASQSDEQ